ncbi:unnamed protein product [Effrenium voratum]|uniref:Uncharacterized protein n=1 Tax=Effrenium voratum TaxID=2562239 RepID=A0AA36J5K3_9DINO|nr:unnamed protein product [Effrenium voratum]
MSGSSSSSSSSSSSESNQDEAASDPESEEADAPESQGRQGRPAPAAAPAPAVPKPEAPRPKPKKRPAEEEEQEAFRLSIESLQGRWRHSVSSLGMLCVKGRSVKFVDGSSYELKELSPGRIDMCGWQTVAARSSPEVIVWSLESDPATTCNWLLEEDVDQNTLEGLDSRNIIQGKRRRAKVDYAALERQIDQEQKKTQDVFSDRSSDSGEGEGESLEMSPKEWAEHHAKQSAKAAGEFRKWMLSTCTSRHEELLRRKGLLVTRMPVALVGPGRRTLEKELAPYGVKLRFHCQETVVLVDASCRERFQAKHPQEWRDAREAKESPTTAAPVASPPALAAPAAPAAPAATSASQAVSPAKKRRLRRIVTDSDDEAPEAEAPSTEAPQSTSEGQVPDLQAAWSEVEEKSGVVPTPEADKAKGSPPPVSQERPPRRRSEPRRRLFRSLRRPRGDWKAPRRCRRRRH